MKKKIKHDSLTLNICHKLTTELKTFHCVTARMQDNGFTSSHDHVIGDLQAIIIPAFAYENSTW